MKYLPRLPDSPRAQAVLHRRAVRLACETDKGRQAPQGELFLALRLGASELYGIPYRWLDEILRPRGITPVPGTEAFVVGVMARRGRLVTVLDLARLMGIEPGAEDAETRVVVVSAAGLNVGLRVAEVVGNERFDHAALGPALPPGDDIGRDWISGVHDGRLTMLDLDALLDSPRIKNEEPL